MKISSKGLKQHLVAQARGKKPLPKNPTRDEIMPKRQKDFVWVGPDDKKRALRVLDEVSKNISTALDTEFPTQGPRKDEAIIWSLSGAADQRYVLHGRWLQPGSPFAEWIEDPKNKLVYFSFAADADIIEQNAKVDATKSFYADVKVEGWLRNNNKRRIALKEEGADYLKWFRKDYGHLFGYFPYGKQKWVTIGPDVLWDGPLPQEMLDVMSHADWRWLFQHYAADDAEMTHTLHRVNKQVLKKWGYWDTYLALDKPYTVTLRAFQKRGIPIDMEELKRLDRLVTADIKRHQTCLRLIAGKPDLKFSSQSKDLRKLIFEEWEWPTYDDLYTDGEGGAHGGKPQLNKFAWQRYAQEEGFTFARTMLPYNKLQTLKNTFINGIANGVKYGPGFATNTLYSEYNQTGTKSGRMSSRKFDVFIPKWKHYKTKPSIEVLEKKKAGMNMLNFPASFNDAYGIRGVVVAPPPDEFAPEGYELICGDFAGFELWMILYWCHKWGIKSKMLPLLLKDADVHSMAAKEMLGLDLSLEDIKAFHKDKRDIGKKGNFGLGYGAGWRVFCRILSKGGELTEWDARSERVERKVRRMIDAWNDLWPEMLKYQAHCVSLGYKQGFVPTIAGRRIWVEEGLNSSDDGTVRHYENLCKNGPAQGSAADITKDAQNIIEADPVLKKLGYRQFFNVYDEIVGAIPKRYAAEGVARQKWCMQQPFSKARHAEVAAFLNVLPYELRCEVHSGSSWKEAK